MAFRPGQRKTQSNKTNNNSYDNSGNSYDDDGFYNDTTYTNDTYDDYNQHDPNATADANYYQDDNAQYAQDYDNNYNQNNQQYSEDLDDSSLRTKKKKKFIPIRPKTRKQNKKTSSFRPIPVNNTQQPNTSSKPFKPQQPANTNQSGGSFFGNANNFQSFAQAGLAAAATSGVLGQGLNAQTASNMLNQLPISIAPGILSFRYYKYYFRVDNQYVLKKLGRLLMPFLKMRVKQWKRMRIDEVDLDNNTAPPPQHFAGYSYQPPVYDINAPDGYIPLMAIITYIVIMGFVVGNQSTAGEEGGTNMTFSPQVLIATGSSAFVMLLIEVLLMKIGFYLIGSVATPPYWIDIICYVGYKLIFVTINLILNLVWANLIFYYIVSVATGIFAAVFMIQTLRPYFRDLSEFASGGFGDIGSGNEPKKTRKIFLGIVGIAQIIFIQLMGRYTSL